MQAPVITTAVPRHRYSLGDYEATLLGDIESPDEVRYQYILALVRKGESSPVLYVTAEMRDRQTCLRLIMAGLDEEMGASRELERPEGFAQAALAVAARALGLGDEPARRLT